MNSSYGNDETIRKQLGRPSVLIHPQDAQERHLAEGDDVMLVNDTGEMRLAVMVSAATQPGVCIVYKGRWPSAAPDHTNVNVLVAGRKSDIAESTTVHGTEAAIIRIADMRAAE